MINLRNKEGIMIILRKTFSKKSKSEKPSATQHLIQGGITAYVGSRMGKQLGETISQVNQMNEVSSRIINDLPKRSAAGDVKAAEMLSKINNNPKAFWGEISEVVKKSPRTKKAGNTGKYVGIAIPAVTTSASYAIRKRKYDKNKKEEEKDKND